MRLIGRHWWQLFFGAVAAVIGLLMDVQLVQTPIPSWVWYLLLFGALVWSQCMAFVTLHKEVKTHRDEPEADSSLYAVFDYVYEIETKDPNLSSPIEATTNRIIEKALVGKIQIFGTRKNPDEGDGVIEPIDSEYWREHSFTSDEPHHFNLSPNDQAKRMKTTGEGEIYHNLRADSSQVFLCWPQKKRLRLQWPFRRESV